MTNTILTKRGLEANRTSVTPAEGELIYTTDQKKLYVGDGATAGGVAVSSASGERDFVAASAIAAGKAVALNYNGKIEEVFSINQANATGTPATMTTTGATAEASFTVYDDVNDKIVWLYRNSSGFPVVVVGTVGSLTVTWGTPVVVASISCAYYTIAYVGNGKVVVSFSLSSNDDGVAYVGTVSGNSISFGAQATFSTGQVQFLSSAYDKANDRVAVVYRDGAGSDYGRLVVGQVSGTSITFGTPAVYSGTTTISNSSVVYDDAAGKIVIFADAGASAADVRYCVATISGNSATFGTLTSIVVSAVQAFSYAAYDTKNKKYLVAYRTATTTFSGKFGTYSGGTITWSDAGAIDSVSHPVRYAAIRHAARINLHISGCLNCFDAVAIDRHPLFADIGNSLGGGDCCLFSLYRGGDDLCLVGFVLVALMADVPLLSADSQACQQKQSDQRLNHLPTFSSTNLMTAS